MLREKDGARHPEGHAVAIPVPDEVYDQGEEEGD